MGKLFAAPSTNPAANATAVPTALHRGRDTASWIPWSIDCNERWQQVLRRNHHRYFECGVLIPFGELFRDRLREDDPSPSTWRRRRTFGSVRCSSPHQSPRANALASAFSTHDEPSVWNSGGTHRAHNPESARVGDSRATGVSGAGQLSTNCSWTSSQAGQSPLGAARRRPVQWVRTRPTGSWDGRERTSAGLLPDRMTSVNERHSTQPRSWPTAGQAKQPAIPLNLKISPL